MTALDTVKTSVAVVEDENSKYSFDGLLNVIGGGFNLWDRFDQRKYERRILEQQIYTAGATVPVQTDKDEGASSSGFLKSIKTEQIVLGSIGLVTLIVLLKVIGK